MAMLAKSTRVLVAAIVLAATSLTLAANASPRSGPSAAMPAGAGYQGEAPPWSFACMKDHGPTRCGEPMWIYGN
jgi:hypothetical protein